MGGVSSSGARHFVDRLIGTDAVALQQILDRGSIELLADSGTVVLTDQYFPDSYPSSVQVRSVGGTTTLQQLDVHDLVAVDSLGPTPS